MSQGKNVILLGAQWGDEGKGRITDLLANEAGVVVRTSGGPNAGHTIITGESEAPSSGRFELHQIPSGILYPEKKNVIGNGVVLHPPSLVQEMEGLRQRGISLEHLYVSDRAHVIMPYHLLLDRLEEERKGKKEIGTTRKGIGPAYADKAARRGLRVADLLDSSTLPQKLEEILSYTNALLSQIYQNNPLSAQDLLDEYHDAIEIIRPHVADTSSLLDEARRQGQGVLFEGAQGALLDLDHGTYPFVTSSCPTAGGVCMGAGFGPAFIDEVLGIIKAYVTRVGAGPFPTEDDSPQGKRLRKQGYEFGVTTQRPRRCGWFDVPLARHSARVNGLTHLALTKLDVLSGFDSIPLCTHYLLDNQPTDLFPPTAQLLEQLTPVYEELPGWSEDLSAVTSYEQLPSAAKAYIARIEELLALPISLVSVGPQRQQFLRCPPPHDH